jgi:hypothetical protein
MIGLAEEAGERADRFEQQRVEAGLLVGGVAGAELGDRGDGRPGRRAGAPGRRSRGW